MYDPHKSLFHTFPELNKNKLLLSLFLCTQGNKHSLYNLHAFKAKDSQKHRNTRIQIKKTKTKLFNFIPIQD